MATKATGWKVQGLNSNRGNRIFPSRKSPDRRLGPPSPTLWGYQDFYPEVRGVRLTTHFHLAPGL